MGALSERITAVATRLREVSKRPRRVLNQAGQLDDIAPRVAATEALLVDMQASLERQEVNLADARRVIDQLTNDLREGAELLLVRTTERDEARALVDEQAATITRLTEELDQVHTDLRLILPAFTAIAERVGVEDGTPGEIEVAVGLALDQLAEAQATITQLAEKIARKNLRIEVLTADLEACRGDEVVVTGLVGHNLDKKDSPWSDTTRMYDGNTGRIPMERAKAQPNGVLSLKASTWEAVQEGAYDEWIEQRRRDISEIKAARPPGENLEVSFHHEPEDDFERIGPGQGFDPAHWVQACRRMTNRGIPITPCFMGWSFEPSANRAKWIEMLGILHDLTGFERFGVDTYCKGDAIPGKDGGTPGKWRSLEDLLTLPLQWCRDRGVQLEVWETNAAESPTDPDRKANWIRAAGAFCEREAIPRLMFFDGEASFIWKAQSSPRATAALHEVAARPYFGGDGA